MFYLNNICFACFRNEDNLIAVYHKETDNEIFIQVKYALPELILNPENPVYICSSCNTILRSFFIFKKKCLDNYSRLNDYINLLQGSNQTSGQSELQIRLINCIPMIKYENITNLNIKENEDTLQHGQKTEVDDNVEVKEESLASEDSADRAFYQQLVKSGAVSDDELDGRSSATSEDNSALDKDETYSNTHTDSQQFQCSICNEVFTDRLPFDNHLKMHINYITDLECLICNKKVCSKYSLKRHMKIHAGIKDYKCSICEKKFSLNNNLKRHMKMHSGIKNYKCSICKNKFSRNDVLKNHMKMHTGIKDYKCSICEKKFSQSSYLQIHMKIHAGIKDYECSVCNQKFVRNQQLKRHVDIYHND